jgi:hypothetical protein
MQKPILIIGAIVILILGILYFFTGTEDTVLNGDSGVVTKSCQEDVFAAQDMALGKVCTQQFQALICPDDPLFVYDATNGCEISFLSDRGWVREGL